MSRSFEQRQSKQRELVRLERDKFELDVRKIKN